MQLRCLENTDEHEDIASPSANDLDHPSLPLRRKDGVLFSVAVTDVPEDVASRTALTWHRGSCRPRRVGQASRGASSREVREHLRFGIDVAKELAMSTAELP